MAPNKLSPMNNSVAKVDVHVALALEPAFHPPVVPGSATARADQPDGRLTRVILTA